MSEMLPYRSSFQWPEGAPNTTSEIPAVAPEHSNPNVAPVAERPETVPATSSEETHSPSHHTSLPPQQADPVVRIEKIHATSQASLNLTPRANSSPEEFQFTMDDVDADTTIEDPNHLSPRTALVEHALVPRRQPSLPEAVSLPHQEFSARLSAQQNQPLGIASSSRAPIPQSYGQVRTYRGVQYNASRRHQVESPDGRPLILESPQENTSLPPNQIPLLNLPAQSLIQQLHSTTHPQPHSSHQHQRQQSQNPQSSHKSDHPPNLLYPGPRPTESLSGMIRHFNNYGAEPGVPLLGNINDPRWCYEVGYGLREEYMGLGIPLTNGHSTHEHSSRFLGQQGETFEDIESGWKSGNYAIGGEMGGNERGEGFVGMFGVDERSGDLRSERTEHRLLGEPGTYRMDGPRTARTNATGPPSNLSSDISPLTIRPNIQHGPGASQYEPQDEPSPGREEEVNLGRGRDENDGLILPQNPLRRAAISAPSGFNLAITALVGLAQPDARQEKTQEVPSVAGSLSTLQVDTTPAEYTDGDGIVDEMTTAGPSSSAQSEPEAESQLPQGSPTLDTPSSRNSSGTVSQEERTISHVAQTTAETSLATPTSHFRSRTQTQSQTQEQVCHPSTTSSSDHPSPRTAFLPSQTFEHAQSSSPRRNSGQSPRSNASARGGQSKCCAYIDDFEVPIWAGFLLALILVLLMIVFILGVELFERQLLEFARGRKR